MMPPQQWHLFLLAKTLTAAAFWKVRAAAWADGTPGIPKCGLAALNEKNIRRRFDRLP